MHFHLPIDDPLNDMEPAFVPPAKRRRPRHCELHQNRDGVAERLDQELLAAELSRPPFRAPKFLMLNPAYDELMEFLTNTTDRDERGGMLVGRQRSEVVTHFVPDPEAATTSATYTPNTEFLNATLRQFMAFGMNAKGLAHRHPAGCVRPSYGDMEYVGSTFGRAKNAAATQFYLPIVAGGVLYPFVVFRDEPNVAHAAELVLL